MKGKWIDYINHILFQDKLKTQLNIILHRKDSWAERTNHFLLQKVRKHYQPCSVSGSCGIRSQLGYRERVRASQAVIQPYVQRVCKERHIYVIVGLYQKLGGKERKIKFETYLGHIPTSVLKDTMEKTGEIQRLWKECWLSVWVATLVWATQRCLCHDFWVWQQPHWGHVSLWDFTFKALEVSFPLLSAHFHQDVYMPRPHIWRWLRSC